MTLLIIISALVIFTGGYFLGHMTALNSAYKTFDKELRKYISKKGSRLSQAGLSDGGQDSGSN